MHHSDFEISIVKAASNIFPSAKFFGCNFHFSQIIWRKIQDLNLVVAYKNNENFRKFVSYLLLLSYVPVQNIDYEYQKLKLSVIGLSESIELLRFFERSFLFPKDDLTKRKDFWSVNERILSNLPTTTNSLEAWHKHLNSFITKNSENIGKIIDILKMQEKKTKLTINNLLTGRIKSKQQNKNLIIILNNYKNYIDLEFFEYLDECIKFKLS
ncbi:hypothetical protein DMUE_0619 [Dictyocoela muelleri]|nr:hypothetical protein DMUE_0619 [Dictyocoela muelleri]